jgi:DNA-binding response OmpR family regulator
MSSPRGGPDGLPARVLVVDDDADILNFIRGVLEDEGLAVIAVPDGGQAVAVAAEFEPDMLIVDVTLPVLSGHRVTTRLRELRGTTFPVLVITADGQAADKARQLGAYAYLKKPFDLDDLLESVRVGLAQMSEAE